MAEMKKAAKQATTTGHGHLAHHFATPRQQFESGKTGMWLFLCTEVLLFSGLFCVYAVYRANHPDIFVYAHQYLDKRLGGLNTVVLILSSLTAAWAVRAAQLGRRRQLIGLILATLFCACCFLGVKAVEYEHKWKHGLLWGTHFHPTEEAGSATVTEPAVAAVATAATAANASATRSPAAVPNPLEIHSTIPPAAQGPAGLAKPAVGRLQSAAKVPAHSGTPEGERPRNVQIFFGIYFAMTGLHGIHVIAGMIAWIVALRRAVRGDFGPDYYTPIDLTALYWHLVDVIWIYLFPLLYLIH